MWVVVWLLLLFVPQKSTAHELLPTIADLFTPSEEVLTLDFRINLEAFLAGVDLDAVANTDEDAASEGYDTLRALPAEALALRAGEIVARWNAQSLVIARDPIALEIQELSIPDDVDFELPRISELRVTGTLPAGAKHVVVQWPAGAGALVLRQQGVPEPYTGYLNGGASSREIALASDAPLSSWQAFSNVLPLGFRQFLPAGFDHTLFVLALLLTSTRWGMLWRQVSLFTLAHALALAAGALGGLQLSNVVLLPLIALSVVVAGLGALFQNAFTPWRLTFVSVCGVLHGLGFAAALNAVDMPDAVLLPGLLGFVIGIALGQITVILGALCVFWAIASWSGGSRAIVANEARRAYPALAPAYSTAFAGLIVAAGAVLFASRAFV